MCEFAASNDGGQTWEERPAPELEPFTQCGSGSALTGTQDIVAARMTFEPETSPTLLATLTGLSRLLLGAGVATAVAALVVRRRTSS